jgi:NADH-quinone oxidoreductase subunit G
VVILFRLLCAITQSWQVVAVNAVPVWLRLPKDLKKTRVLCLKLVASCRTGVMDGMEVQNITSPEVVEARKGVVEMLLINHPLIALCATRPASAIYRILGFEHGAAKTRYEFDRRTFEKIDIGDKIQLHMTRCILCYRCVFTADQITNHPFPRYLEQGRSFRNFNLYPAKLLITIFQGT